MEISKYFSKRSKKSQVYQATTGRIARMERLEDRRVLAVFMVNGDGDSIQDAVNAAINKPGPDTVLLKPDNYFQEVNITGEDSELTILGMGNVRLNGVDFAGNDDEIVDVIDNTGVVILKNLTIKNSQFDSANVYVRQTHQIDFYNVHVLDSSADGVDAQNVDYLYAYDSKFNSNQDNGIELGPGVDYVYLKDVQAKGNYGNGLYYDNNSTQQGLIDIYSGDFSRNEGDGIYTDNVEEVYIDTIYANNNKGDGLSVENGDVEVIDVNYAAFDRNGSDGMELFANPNNGYIEITETRALENKDDGLEINDAAEALVYNSEYSYNGENGLESNYVDKLTIDYIAANHNGTEDDDDLGDGLEVSYVDDLVVKKSEFLKNEDDGIDVILNDHAEAVIDFVEASYNYDNGVELDGYGSASIITVGMRNNDGNGLRSSGLKYLYIHNSTATYNGRNGVKVLGEGNRTDVYAHYNNFSHNHLDGFNAKFAGDILIKQLKAEHNYDNGVDSDGAHDIAILESPFIRYNLGGDFGGNDFI